MKNARQNNIKAFINNKLINKIEVLFFIDRFIDDYSTNSDISSYKKEIMLSLLEEFKAKIIDTEFFVENKLWYFYSVCHLEDGFSLKLNKCTYYDAVEHEEEYTELFELVKSTCNYISCAEFSKKYHVEENTVRQWIRRGKIRSAIKNGRDWLIPELIERPERGFKEVEYSVNTSIDEIFSQFSFLKGYDVFYLRQDLKNMKQFYLSLNNSRNGEHKTIELDTSTREKLEHALISSSAVKRNVGFLGTEFNLNHKNKYIYRGGKIMLNEDKNDVNEFVDGGYELDFNINYSNMDVAFTHTFNVSLKKCNEETGDLVEVVNIIDGIIIPSENTDDERYYQWEFCDSDSGDTLCAYEAIGTYHDGIKEEVLKDLEIDDTYKYDSSIMYFDFIKYNDPKELDFLLRHFYLVKEGLPTADTKIALVLLNWEKESEMIKIFTNNKWIIKPADESNVVAYRKL